MLAEATRIPPSCFVLLAVLIVPVIVVRISRAMRPPPKDQAEALMQQFKDAELKDKVCEGTRGFIFWGAIAIIAVFMLIRALTK